MRRNEKKKTIQRQIARAIAGVSVVMTGLFLAAFQGVRGVIIRQYSNAAEQSVYAASENMDYMLQEIETLSKSILFNQEMMDALKKENREAFLSQLTGYYNSNSIIEGIYVEKGEHYWYVGSNIESGRENFPREVLEDTSGEIVWTPTREVHVQILSGRVPRNYFSMTRKIVDIDSLEETGSLCIELDERILQETYAGLKEPGAEIYIIDREGNTISSLGGKVTGNQSFQEILDGSMSGGVESGGNHQDWVTIYSTLNQNRWKMIKTIPKATLYAEINHLQIWVMIGTGLVFALALAAGSFYSNQITKPVLKLIKQMKDVEKGDFTVSVDTNVNNELGDLGKSFNHMIRKIQGLMEEVVIAERNKNEMELEILHAQINPHFLYNTLNTIRWMAKIKKEESISASLVALVKLLRVSISLGKNLITLREEIGYIENYILIQRLRFDQRFQIQYEIRSEDEEVLIPKLILQPIVENSLIYGIEEEGDPEDEHILTIRIFTETCETGMRIIIEDNGPGISSEVIESIFKQEKNINKFSKVGLNNINQRIKMHLGEVYGLQVIPAPLKGTRVIIWVPRCIE